MIRSIVKTELFEKKFSDGVLIVFRYYITQNGKKFDFNEKRKFPMLIFNENNYDIDTILDLGTFFVKNLYHYGSGPFEALLDKFVAKKIKIFKKNMAFYISDYSVPINGIYGLYNNKIRVKVVSKKYFCAINDIFEFKKGQLFIPEYYITFENTKPEETSLKIEVSAMLGKLYFYRLYEVF